MAVLGSAPVVLKIVGPTADYVGGGVKNLVERQVENVERVFAKAARKLGEEGLERPGVVPPRVLKEVIEGASFCEDELGAEYFGGILAAAKSEDGRDDRGASLAALAGRLSSYQLRCHYLMYAYAQRQLKGSQLQLGFSDERQSHGQFFIPFRVWLPGMEFSESERGRKTELAGHCCVGLVREDLIDSSGFGWGVPDNLSRLFRRQFDEGGVAYQLSVLGVELFTAAHGIRQSPLVAFVEPTQSFVSEIAIPDGDGVTALQDLPRLPQA